MKQISRIRMISIFLVSSYSLLQAAAPITPFISMRSQGQDLARYLSGVSQFVDLDMISKGQEIARFLSDDPNYAARYPVKGYGVFSLITEYTESFKSNNLARCLFGNYACNSQCPAAIIPISGSRVADRGNTDWLADYFYLPTDFQSNISFSPKIENLIFDIDFYMGLDKWVDGLFFRFEAPVVWTRWNLNLQEKIINAGVNNYDPGYFDGFTIPPQPGIPAGIGIFRNALLDSFEKYVAGDTVVDNPTDFFTQLKFAKITACADAKTSIADLHFTLGYNALNCANYHAGFGLYVVAPTGNRVLGDYFFEPIVGNGKHWEVGAWLTGGASLWTNCDGTMSAGFYADATITHMIGALQRRTFDLKNKPFSRYMIAQNMSTPSIADGNLNNQRGNGIAPQAVFNSEFQPVANITTQEVIVSVGVQADIVAEVSLQWNHFQWDIGYNFWGRSCEKIRGTCTGAPCLLSDFPEQKWALKGDAYVFGIARTADAVAPTLKANQAVPISATQSQATILSGTNFPATGATTDAQINAGRRNPNIDNPQLATAGGSNTILDATANVGTIAEDQTHTSIQPIFIKGSDVDLVGTSGLSNKIYTNLSHVWAEREFWTPYLGVGGFAEFGSSGNGCTTQACNTNNNCSNNNCTNTCVRCSVSQWGLWLKGGVAF